MKYNTTIYGIDPTTLPSGYKKGLKMCLNGAKNELQMLIKEDTKICEWDIEKEDKIKYLNKSCDFFIAKIEEIETKECCFFYKIIAQIKRILNEYRI